MREILIAKVSEKQRATQRVIERKSDVEKNIERKRRIIEDAERKIEYTREGIASKEDQLSGLEQQIAEAEEALTLMQEVVDLYDARQAEIVTSRARIEEIQKAYEPAMLLSPRTAPKPQEDPEYQTLMLRISELQNFNAQAETDIRRVFYGKAKS